eukprot:TRINITY_DN2073_c0_g1_i2.p1 TRINITY_DN2073_c0_g1~~TRINITY_DN2073_c0_g1_i2.p1  ORF type:complete len:286 (+),score=39.11 TRINITY_DN2073_c0_g1_i2:93-950(+)
MSRKLNKCPNGRTNSKRIEAGLIETLIQSFCILPNRFAVITPECEQFFKTKNYEAFKRKINRQNWKLQNRYVKDLVLRDSLEKFKCSLVFIPANSKQVTQQLEDAFALMGGQDTTEAGRVLPSAALISFFDNGLKYFPAGYWQASTNPSNASISVIGTTSSAPSTIPPIDSMDDQSLVESESGCENELSSMEELASQAPSAVTSSYCMPPPQQFSDEVYASYDELSDSNMSPRALALFDEKGVMDTELLNQIADCLPETFEEFFESTTQFGADTPLSHHGYPHSF